MPISIDEYREPSWIKIRERYSLSYDKRDRFCEHNPGLYSKRFAGIVDTAVGWKLPGYNPAHNSTRIERINLRSDDIQIKHY